MNLATIEELHHLRPYPAVAPFGMPGVSGMKTDQVRKLKDRERETGRLEGCSRTDLGQAHSAGSRRGLKVPARQPKRGCFGSMMGLVSA